MKKLYCCICLIMFIFTGFSCKSSENTRFMRFHHAFRSRYNIYYNAKISFDTSRDLLLQQKKGLVSGKDSIIREGFTYTINKCQKAIDLYSIRKKPPLKPGWKRKPKQVALQQQTEYNPFLLHCWLLLGKAQFFREEYQEALLTFDYILRTYKENDLVTEARAWKSFCYLSMDMPEEAAFHMEPLDDKTLKKKQWALVDSIKSRITSTRQEKEISIPPEGETKAIPFSRNLIDFDFHPPERDAPLIQEHRKKLRQDIYQRAYDAYLAGDHLQVRYGWTNYRELYAGSDWDASFLFIYALTWVVEGDTENFRRAMEQLLSFGESAFSSIAGTSLSMIEQGVKVYPDHITPFRRDLNTSYVKNKHPERNSPAFSHTPTLPHYLLIYYPEDYLYKNELLYKVAAFNFTHFLISHLDLKFDQIGNYRFLLIKNFRNLSEINDYLDIIKGEKGYLNIREKELSILFVSESNYEAIKKRMIWENIWNG